MKKKEEELVLCIYEKNGVSIEEKILDIFINYVKSNLELSKF